MLYALRHCLGGEVARLLILVIARHLIIVEQHDSTAVHRGQRQSVTRVRRGRVGAPVMPTRPTRLTSTPSNIVGMYRILVLYPCIVSVLYEYVLRSHRIVGYQYTYRIHKIYNFSGIRI